VALKNSHPNGRRGIKRGADPPAARIQRGQEKGTKSLQSNLVLDFGKGRGKTERAEWRDALGGD